MVRMTPEPVPNPFPNSPGLKARWEFRETTAPEIPGKGGFREIRESTRARFTLSK